MDRLFGLADAAGQDTIGRVLLHIISIRFHESRTF